MKPMTVTLVVLGVVFDGWLSSGQSQEPKKDRNPIMQMKLSHAQKVLEGIALNDFNLIEKHADELIILSNKAEWKVLPTRDYLLQSNEFRRNAELLTKAAKGKNLDGATLAYVQLTMSCVSCHKHVREVRMARLD
jgi:cytochrome c556